LWPAKFLPKHDPDFISHLEEFRYRLIVSLVTFVAVSVISYFFSKQILDFLIEPLRRHQEVQLYFQKPYEAFLIHLQVAALSGVVVASPVLVTQLWLFIAPGLFEHEKRVALPLILITTLLFFSGVIFAYRVVIPWGLYFLLSFQTESLKPLLGVGPYFSFLIGMILACGVLFDFPVMLVGLVQLGILRTAQIARARRAVIVVIFIVAAVLTPSPDPISQLMLALPLLGLFEISLAVARVIEKKRPKS